MRKIFKCIYCDNDGGYLTSINFDDTESMEEAASDIAESLSFKCSCGAEYQFGLFDLQTKKPLKAHDFDE